ncbi:hypothetical protein [Streptomyces mutabilis]|uniref:hypothetical protein n=1 Tax=Streptomyces mutabilis TaxID=67332 RepID=UPI0034E00A7B
MDTTDCSQGVNRSVLHFLETVRLTERSGPLVRLHRPPRSLVRIAEITRSGALLHFVRPGPGSSHDVPAAVEGVR